MNIILLTLAGLAAGGVLKAIIDMRRLARERKKNKEALKKFEQQHPTE